MANTRRGPLHYIDSTGILSSEQNTKIAQVFITCTSAGAILVLSDLDGTPLLDLRLTTANTSQQMDLSATPLVFSKGLRVTTLTNAIVTLVYTNKGSTT